MLTLSLVTISTCPGGPGTESVRIRMEQEMDAPVLTIQSVAFGDTRASHTFAMGRRYVLRCGESEAVLLSEYTFTDSNVLGSRHFRDGISKSVHVALG